MSADRSPRPTASHSDPATGKPSRSTATKPAATTPEATQPATTNAPAGTTDPTAGAPANRGPGIVSWAATAHATTSGLLAVLVLIQAGLAGQAMFGPSDFLVHGYVGNVSFTLGFVAAVLAAVGRLPGLLLGLSAATLAALFAQTGLGYVGREVTAAAMWHVPLGVTIFGLVILQTAASVTTVRNATARRNATSS